MKPDQHCMQARLDLQQCSCLDRNGAMLVTVAEDLAQEVKHITHSPCLLSCAASHTSAKRGGNAMCSEWWHFVLTWRCVNDRIRCHVTHKEALYSIKDPTTTCISSCSSARWSLRCLLVPHSATGSAVTQQEDRGCLNHAGSAWESPIQVMRQAECCLVCERFITHWSTGAECRKSFSKFAI